MKFRAKPFEVEAFQYDGDLMNSNGYYVPQWAVDAFERGMLYYGELGDIPAELFVETPDGAAHVALDDYVVQDSEGNLYPCKAELFEKLFDYAED